MGTHTYQSSLQGKWLRRNKMSLTLKLRMDGIWKIVRYMWNCPLSLTRIKDKLRIGTKRLLSLRSQLLRNCKKRLWNKVILKAGLGCITGMLWVLSWRSQMIRCNMRSTWLTMTKLYYFRLRPRLNLKRRLITSTTERLSPRGQARRSWLRFTETSRSRCALKEAPSSIEPLKRLNSTRLTIKTIPRLPVLGRITLSESLCWRTEKGLSQASLTCSASWAPPSEKSLKF